MKTNKNKNFRFAKWALALCLVYFVCSAFHTVIAQIGDYKSDTASVKAQIEEQKQTNKNLQEQKLNMHTEENYREIARKTLGLVDPGDKVYVNTKDNN